MVRKKWGQPELIGLTVRQDICYNIVIQITKIVTKLVI